MSYPRTPCQALPPSRFSPQKGGQATLGCPTCCAAFGRILHDLAAPLCALDTVHKLAPFAPEKAGLAALMADALARLRLLWQQGHDVLPSCGARARGSCGPKAGCDRPR